MEKIKYIEDLFAYAGHDVVWMRGNNAESIGWMDAYAEQFIGGDASDPKLPSVGFSIYDSQIRHVITNTDIEKEPYYVRRAMQDEIEDQALSRVSTSVKVKGKKERTIAGRLKALGIVYHSPVSLPEFLLYGHKKIPIKRR